MKFSKFLIAVGAAALVFTSAAPAFASTAKLRAIPNRVYQGESFVLKAECPDARMSAVISSRLLPHPVRLFAGHRRHYVLVNVGPKVTPGGYELRLHCEWRWRDYSMGGRDFMRATASAQRWHSMGAWARTWVTVLKYTAPSSTHEAARKYLRSHGKRPEVIINTGLGGLAHLVSQHHPAG
jgi:hypothetical protein